MARFSTAGKSGYQALSINSRWDGQSIRFDEVEAMDETKGTMIATARRSSAGVIVTRTLPEVFHH